MKADIGGRRGRRSVLSGLLVKWKMRKSWKKGKEKMKNKKVMVWMEEIVGIVGGTD